MTLSIALAALFGAAAMQAAPTTPSAPITIGISHELKSAALNDKRTVNVVLPASYAREPARRYPVLYLIDGGVDQDLLHVAGVASLNAVWGRSAEAIVVGIETRDRRRELTGPTSDPELLAKYPTAGSSAAFRSFIRNAVKPLVEAAYRTSGEDAVLGESLAGLFVVETYLLEPGLFDAFAAIDPSLWWDKQALSLQAAGRLAAAQSSRPLYLAMAREQVAEPEAMKRLTEALKAKGAKWCLAERPDLFHATIYQQLTPQALQFLFPPAEPPAPEFGFEVQCSAKS